MVTRITKNVRIITSLNGWARKMSHGCAILTTEGLDAAGYPTAFNVSVIPLLNAASWSFAAAPAFFVSTAGMTLSPIFTLATVPAGASSCEYTTEARASATQVKVDASTITDPETFKKFQEAQAQLSGALGRLLAVSERYPDLKSNQNFLALQSQLEGTENRIAVARRDYIEAVRQYNTELRTFPGVIWASTLYKNNKPMETFTVAEDVKTPPQVKF